MNHTVLLLLVLMLGCSSSTDSNGRQWVNIEEIQPAASPIAPATECTVMTADEQPTSGIHVAECSDLTFDLYPPATGNHYPRWADFRTYEQPVPWGFLVHSMEHGAVVLSYNCDCPEVVAAFEAVVAAHGVDPACSGVDSRFIIAPDPNLDVPIAATGWGKVYRATCLDMTSLSAFVEGAYAAGPEDLCARGYDGETAGWCV